MPATTKKPIKIVPNTIKTIPKIAPATIIPKKTLEEQLEEIYDDINIDLDDLSDDLVDVYEELEGSYKEKSILKNWKLWTAMFTPFILPAFIKGVAGQVTLPYDAKQSVQSNTPEPKVVVDYAKKYFEKHGLELVRVLSKTDCERLKVQITDNWGKGPDAFKKSFQEDYANTKARLDAIYRTEYVTAQNEGILARSRNAGHKFKQWNAALDERTCPVCGDQLHGTIIPIEEEFTAVVEHKNGSEEISVNGPPAHPNCRCVLTTLDEEDYNEMKEDSAYLDDVVNTIKLNYKCKAGTVDDSNKCNPEQDKPSNGTSTKDISTTLQGYQDYAYTAINDQLRGTNKIKQTPEQTENIKKDIATIDAEMQQHPRKTPITVYRADGGAISSEIFSRIGLGDPNVFKVMFGKEKLTPEDIAIDKINGNAIATRIKNLLKGEEYTEKAFMSTGRIEKNVDDRFVNGSSYLCNYGVQGLVEVTIPKGVNALRMSDYTGVSDELGGKIDEYLIDRNQTLVVKDVQVLTKDDGRHLYLKYKMEIKPNKQRQDSAYLADAFETIKLNYNCPDSEKVGEGPGSCSGGSKPNVEKETSSSGNEHKNITMFPISSNNKSESGLEFYARLWKVDPEIYDMIKEKVEGSPEYNLFNKLGDKWLRNIEPEAREDAISVVQNNKLLKSYLLHEHFGLDVPEKTTLYRVGRAKTGMTNSFFPNKQVAEAYQKRMGVESIHEYEVPTNEVIPSLSGAGEIWVPGDVESIIEKQNSSYLSDAFETIKLNYKCPKGTVDDSNKCNTENESSEPKNFGTITLPGLPDNMKLDKNSFGQIHEAIQRNVFNLNVTKIDENNYFLNVSPKNIPENWITHNDDNDRNINKHFDPEFFEIKPLFEGSKITKMARKKDFVDSLEGKEDGHLFRGMSYDEYENIQKSGYIQSKGGYNFDNQEGLTYFSLDKGQASYYASGFAPWQYKPTPDKPAVMVTIKEPSKDRQETDLASGSNEVGVRGKVPSSDIVDVYFGYPVAFEDGYLEIRKENGIAVNGSAIQYDPKIRWEKQQKQDSSYLEDVTNFIKLNYKCPKGTVDDSNKCEPEQEKSNTSDSKSASETFIGFKADHDFSSPQDVETNKRIQASLDKAAEPLKKFSKNDRHVLTMYSGGRFHQINEYLNGSMKDMENSNDVFDKANVKESKQLIEKLDKLFTNSDLSEPLVTYRGISNKTLSKYPELVNALDTPGSEIEFPCFSSTSALPFMANNFTTDENGRMGRLLELQLPSGTKALFIAEESVLPNEFEILVNRGTKFKVVETKYTDIVPPNSGIYQDTPAKHVKITTIKAIV